MKQKELTKEETSEEYYGKCYDTYLEMNNTHKVRGANKMQTKVEQTEQTQDETIKEEKVELTWIKQEIKQLNETNQEFTGERLPYMKFEEKKIAEINIDISKPFGEWIDPQKGTKKAIVELLHREEKKVWFLNKRNPIYRQILEAITKGTTKFKILQIGSQADTKYEIIE